MPLYEYACRKCSQDFEELVFGRDEEVCCPACGSAKVKRKLSAFAVHGKRADGSSISASSCSKSSCSGCSTSGCGCHH